MDPLSAYRQKLDQQQKLKNQKKGNNPVGIYVAVGVGALFLITLLVLYANSGGSSKGKTPSGPTDTYTANVNLSESQKREVYISICRYREMLTSSGGTARRAYEIVAEQNGITVNGVQQVEAEGTSKQWPRK